MSFDRQVFQGRLFQAKKPTLDHGNLTAPRTFPEVQQEDDMADREVHTHTSSGSSGVGILGVIVGAALVIGAIFFFTGGFNIAGGGGGGDKTSVTINADKPAAPSTPKAPAAPATTGAR